MGEKVEFPCEGELLELWKSAEADFLASNPIPELEKQEAARFQSDPESWLKAFQHSRHKTGRLDRVCEKVGRHFKQIQITISFLGFAVNVVSAAVPAASPASLVVNAVAYLFVSVTKVAEDFDKVEAFFKQLASRFDQLSPLEGEIGQLEELGDHLKESIIGLFKSCLEISSIGIAQTNHRFRKFQKKLLDDDELSDALSKATEAEENLTKCIRALTLALVAKTHRKVSKIADQYKDHERDDILDWLSKLNFNTVHQSLQERVGESLVAGRWLLESDTFTRWRDGDINRLWCTGAPGAGKSVLASIITEHLRNRVHEPANGSSNAMVACLYLSYKADPGINELLGNILRQFESDSTEIHSEVRNLFKEYQRHGRSFRALELRDTKELLSKLAATRQIYVIVDALDECERGIRYSLMESLQSIPGGAKVLVMSRVLDQQEDVQHGFTEQKIEAHDEDIQDYIDQTVRKHRVLQKFSKEIKELVPQRSGRVFLIVQLHMKALTEIEVPNEVKRVLENLPDTIPASYDHVMIRIMESKQPKRAERAKAILGWVSFARQPLSVQDLQYALASEEVTAKIDEGDLIPESDIPSFGHGLIEVDVDNLVRFFHFSAQEFFNEHRHQLFPEFESRIALVCANYLRRADYEWRDYFKGRPIRAIVDCPFAEYAGMHLSQHYRQVRNHSKDPRLLEAISTLIQERPSREFYCLFLLRFDGYYRKSEVFDKGDPEIWLHGARIHVIPDDLDQWRRAVLIPTLHLAVFLGCAELARNLIKKGSNVEELDLRHQSALTVAFKAGHDDIASILLDCGAHFDLSSLRGLTISLHVAERNQTKAVEKIVQYHPDDEVGGFLEIVGEVLFWLLGFFKLMLDTIFSVRTPSKNLLSSAPALNTGNERAIQTEKALQKYRSFLQLAYRGDVRGLLDLLRPDSIGSIDLGPVRSRDFPYEELSSDSDSDRDGDSDFASDDSYEDASDIFTDSDFPSDESGEDSSDKDDEELDAWDHEKAQKYDTKAKKNHERIKTATIKTACFLAVEKGHFEVIKLLLEYGVNPNLRKANGQGLLHRAIARNNRRLARLLLNYGAKVDLRDRDGNTPLMSNAGVANDKVLQLLKDHGANIDLMHKLNSRERGTALFASAVFGATDVVRYFLDSGADTSLTTDRGWTPLHGAVDYGNVDCVRLLLERGARPSPINSVGETPLDLTAYSSQWYTLKGYRLKGYTDPLYKRPRRTGEAQRLSDEMRELLRRFGAKTSEELRNDNEMKEAEKLLNCQKHDAWFRAWCPRELLAQYNRRLKKAR
ncbi:uncharacterized protein J3D65DRAFT_636864 [Phyllosticta citribraziliensis]|uniref:Ankyrin repeat protein n=1 Tax=Phyllosticta citribraziliensis TaxID=989973 RepID=A0ABR1LB24_9PEZI